MNRLSRVRGVAVAALIVFPVVGCVSSGGGLAPSSSPVASVASTTPAATPTSTPPAATTTPASLKPTPTPTPKPTPVPTHRKTATAAPTHVPVATHTAPPAQPTPTHSAAPSCYPLTNGGNCYEPGEFCRKSDHGATGVAGDGKAIKCEDNNGWRWEPV
jgi:hypothetical protein